MRQMYLKDLTYLDFLYNQVVRLLEADFLVDLESL